MIRMMAVSYLGGKVDAQDVRLPPSSTVDAGGDLYLGRILYPGRSADWLYLRTRDLVKHTGIFATTGSGKTHVAYNLLRQFAKRKIPFLVIDWKRSYRNLKGLQGLETLEVFTVRSERASFSLESVASATGCASANVDSDSFRCAGKDPMFPAREWQMCWQN